MARQWNFLGNKSQLADWLSDNILLPLGPSRVADVCTGSCSVARALAARGIAVWSNDMMFWCTVLARAYLQAPSMAWEAVAEWTRQREPCPRKPGFVHATYTQSGGAMYFTEANGIAIDTTRQEIDAHFGQGTPTADVALAVLLHASMLVANTAGQFRAFLKEFKPSARAALALDIDKLGGNGSSSNGDHIVTCRDVFEIVEDVASWADLIYLDPPYCCRHYPKYYHVLETIARNDSPRVEGRTKCRQDAQASRMGCKTTAKQAFRDFVDRLVSCSSRRANHLVVSYSSEGIVSEHDMKEALSLGGQLEVTIHRHPHPKYQTQTGPRAYTEELAFVVHLDRITDV